jgi:hypothetical protein
MPFLSHSGRWRLDLAPSIADAWDPWQQGHPQPPMKRVEPSSSRRRHTKIQHPLPFSLWFSMFPPAELLYEASRPAIALLFHPHAPLELTVPLPP